MKSSSDMYLTLIVSHYKTYMDALSKSQKIKLQLESLSPNETLKFSELTKELEGLEKKCEVDLAGVLSSIHMAIIGLKKSE